MPLLILSILYIPVNFSFGSVATLATTRGSVQSIEKYFASSWWTMMAEVDCSGTS